MTNFKLLILSCDPTITKWKSLDSKIKEIETALNKTKNAVWTVGVRYEDFKPEVVNGRITQSWYNAISYPLFRQGNQFTYLHFSMKDWKKYKLDTGIRGANQVDDDFVGESYGRGDENTKRGKSKQNQFVQNVLHEVGGHALARACGVPDITHSVHKDNIDLGSVPGFFERYDMNTWHPVWTEGMKEVNRLQALINNLKTAFKRPEAVLPLVQRQADKVLAEMAAIGHPMRITEGLRSIERQNQLYAQGRTTKGSIVTNAKGGESFHNYGVAVDFVFKNEGYNAPEQLWQVFGLVGKKHGFEWGGSWEGFKDRPHLEMTLGYTLKDFQQGKVDYTKFN